MPTAGGRGQQERTYASGERPCSSARSASAMTPSAAASVPTVAPASTSLVEALCSTCCATLRPGVSRWLTMEDLV